MTPCRGAPRFPILALLAAAGCVPGPIGRVSTDATTRRALVAAIDSMVAQPAFRNMHWGILIVDPARGDTLYSRNAGKLFMPASNMKIVTGAVALELLGPEFRFATTYAARERVADSVLAGDLVVHGTGDPSVSEGMRDTLTAADSLRALLAVADSLAARGIRRIRGRLAAGRDAFSDAPYGFGWSWDDFDYAYSAGVDELMLNEGFARVTVRGGAAPGEPPAVTTFPARRYPPVRVTATTIARGDSLRADGSRDSARTRLDVVTEGAGPGVVLSGTILTGDTATLTISYRDQRGAYLAALAEALAARGVTVEHRAMADSTSDGDSLFAILSPPLRDILPRFEKPSQNQIGEILFKTLALRQTGVGTADSARRVVERQLAAWGADTAGFAVRDGSGLSRHNYLTPETLVRVLDVMRQSAHFPVFHDALPIAGVDGTIASRMRNTPAQGNLRAKTGTIDKARSLSGYVTTADGHLLIFSVLSNNFTVPTSWPTRVQDEIGARLAALRLRR